MWNKMHEFTLSGVSGFSSRQGPCCMCSLVSCHPLSSLRQKYTWWWLVLPWIIPIGCCQYDYYAKTLHLFKPCPPRVNIATSTLEANGLLALSKPTKRPLPLSISTVNSGFRRHEEASGHKLSAMSSLFYPHKRDRERDPFLFLLLFQEPSPSAELKALQDKSRPEREEWLEF